MYNDHKVQAIYSGLNRGKERLPWRTVIETDLMNKEVSNEETQEDTQTQHSLHEGINTEKTLVPARRWKKATVAEEEEVKRSGSRWA